MANGFVVRLPREGFHLARKGHTLTVCGRERISNGDVVSPYEVVITCPECSAALRRGDVTVTEGGDSMSESEQGGNDVDVNVNTGESGESSDGGDEAAGSDGGDAGEASDEGGE